MPIAATGRIPASTASSVPVLRADRREDRLAEVVDPDGRADGRDRHDHHGRLADAAEDHRHRERQFDL